MALFEGHNHWEPCPECGADAIEGTGLIFPRTPVCQECGHEPEKSEVKKSFQEVHADVRERMGVGDGYDEQRIADLAEAAEGESITEKSLLKMVSPANDEHLVDLLDPEEQPHYLIDGGTIDVEGGGDSSSLFGDDRSRKISTLGGMGCYVVVTDQRVFCVVQQATGNDYRNIAYDAVTGVDLDTGVVNKRLTVHTKGRTYHFSGFNTAKAECRDAMNYIRKKKEGKSAGESETTSAVDELERLEKLRERGSITEDEFETMKAQIVEENQGS